MINRLCKFYAERMAEECDLEYWFEINDLSSEDILYYLICSGVLEIPEWIEQTNELRIDINTEEKNSFYEEGVG